MLTDIYIAAFITLTYVVFIAVAVIGFLKLNHISKKSINDKTKLSSFLSIVVSARNEEEHIINFIWQIKQQIFSKEQFEIIFIDDASDDKTYEFAKQEFEKSTLQYRIIKQEQHQGKKKNIAQAIKLSKGTIIITTDADIVSRSQLWLQTIADYFNRHNPDMLIMPLDFEAEPNFLSQFQIFENLALTGITAGYAGMKKPFLCNGANLAFKKSTYELVNGYESHQHISSGEDIFLLESFKNVGNTSIYYLLSQEVIVKTKAQNNVISFFNQRVRWASKAKHSGNLLNLLAGTLAILTNFIIIALCIAIFKKPSIVPYLSIFVFIKLIFDFLLLFLAANFLKRLHYLRLFIPITFLYWLYALVIGIASLFYKPYWKGEKIN